MEISIPFFIFFGYDRKMKNTVTLRGILASDAEILFPMIHNSPITKTIVWDGPPNLQEYQKGLVEREQQHREGKVHFFTILEANRPVGSITIRPMNDFRADIGLWVGEKFQGQGFGSEAVKQILDYGFNKLNLRKIEAAIFVGNNASRKIFEKNGFQLEGTIRCALKKRGEYLDEWVFGLVK
jgi:ribosomal-protein-alanine N-acetyltransferase